MLPHSSVTVFGLGYRSGNPQRFLDQVDMGMNMGGLVQVDRHALAIERDQQYSFLNRLRLDHDAAELDLKDFITEEEKIISFKDKFQSNLSEQAKRVEDAYAQRELNTAMGLELAQKNLRVAQSVRFRDLGQQAMGLLGNIRATRQKLSELELDIIRAEHRLRVISSQLRPVNNLNEALNA